MKKTIFATLVFLGSIGVSMAGVHHPRRKEVNHRLENQNDRIHDKVADGKMSKKEIKLLMIASRICFFAKIKKIFLDTIINSHFPFCPFFGKKKLKLLMMIYRLGFFA